MTRRNAYLLRACLSGILALGFAAVPPAFLSTAQAASPNATASPSANPSASPSGGSSSALDRNRELQACAAKAEANPDGARADAQRWRQQGGGDYAALCEALALFHAGEFKAAGGEIEALVPTLGKDDPKAAASLLGRAGWAWLRAGDQERAERLYSAALEKTPDDIDLLIDRAFARAEGERFWDAIADLDAALARDPRRADAYLYRASAHKALSNYRQALADIDSALELKPGDPEAILLRGNVKALGGNLPAARDDWALARRVAPDSEWGRAAADNLVRTAEVAGAAGKDTAKEKKTR
ncbi:tetratricopeptide repeat protein [Azospirillum sp. B510]|uniref:tetratricopeptide repeat protein n=1 Tax=Azospirillum sp. (strain B510) TaxID=137722 RepID=UPI000303AE62|nr:tetratricopeptide repeat protein [Azospirillum sp. B510]